MEELLSGYHHLGKKRVEHQSFYGSETNLLVDTRVEPGYYTFQDQQMLQQKVNLNPTGIINIITCRYWPSDVSKCSSLKQDGYNMLIMF